MAEVKGGPRSSEAIAAQVVAVKGQLSGLRDSWKKVLGDETVRGAKVLDGVVPFCNPLDAVHSKYDVEHPKPTVSGSPDFSVDFSLSDDGRRRIDFAGGKYVVGPQFARASYFLDTDDRGDRRLGEVYYLFCNGGNVPSVDPETGKKTLRGIYADPKNDLIAGIPLTKEEFIGLLPPGLADKLPALALG